MSHRRKTILVTGAAGRLARRLCPLLESHHDLLLTDLAACAEKGIHALDIRNEEACVRAFAESDIVLHCAIAPYFPGDASEISEKQVKQYHESMFEINVRGTYCVYEAARRAKVSHIVYISSMTVVLGEGQASLDSSIPPSPVDIYAVTKLFGEQLGELYSRTHGLRTTAIRLGQPVPLGLPQEQAWLDDENTRKLLVPHSKIVASILKSIDPADQPIFEICHVFGGIEEATAA